MNNTHGVFGIPQLQLRAEKHLRYYSLIIYLITLVKKISTKEMKSLILGIKVP